MDCCFLPNRRQLLVSSRSTWPAAAMPFFETEMQRRCFITAVCTHRLSINTCSPAYINIHTAAVVQHSNTSGVVHLRSHHCQGLSARVSTIATTAHQYNNSTPSGHGSNHPASILRCMIPELCSYMQLHSTVRHDAHTSTKHTHTHRQESHMGQPRAQHQVD